MLKKKKSGKKGNLINYKHNYYIKIKNKSNKK